MKQKATKLKYHGLRFTYRSSPVVSSPSFWVMVIFVLLTLPALACSVINPQYQMNNEVRLAVYQYEREVRGKADDLVIDFRRDEPRIKFDGQNEDGGQTVWLYRLGVQEFFSLRSPEKTYLYIQGIEYDDNHSVATVTIYRGDGTGYEGRTLIVVRDDEHHWSVSSEAEIRP